MAGRQRYQANARERDRTHRYKYCKKKKIEKKAFALFMYTLYCYYNFFFFLFFYFHLEIFNKLIFRDKTQETKKSSIFSVNMAFSALRMLIPTEPADRKLSKIETLRLASSYISHLDAVLIVGPIDNPCIKFKEIYWKKEDTFLNNSMRPKVCTFCLAMHKKHVSILNYMIYCLFK